MRDNVHVRIANRGQRAPPSPVSRSWRRPVCIEARTMSKDASTASENPASRRPESRLRRRAARGCREPCVHGLNLSICLRACSAKAAPRQRLSVVGHKDVAIAAASGQREPSLSTTSCHRSRSVHLQIALESSIVSSAGMSRSNSPRLRAVPADKRHTSARYHVDSSAHRISRPSFRA